MARQSHDREDLLAEATALVERLELTIPAIDSPITLGARRDGCLSLYFGGDPAFHFNTDGELRRAFIAGHIYKAERGILVALTKKPAKGEVQLVRHELTDVEEAAALNDLALRLQQIRQALDDGTCQVTRQEPADLPALARVREWLSSLAEEPVIARLPHAR